MIHIGSVKNGLRGILLFFFLLLFTVLLIRPAYAEGTRDLVKNGGYRPYTERYHAKTFGQDRLSVLQVYLKAGETAYLGTSVSTGTLYNAETAKGYYFTNAEMGTSFSASELAYLNSADIWIYKGTGAELSAGSLPYSGGVQNTNSLLIDLPSSAGSTTPGFIYNGAQEAGGPDLTGTGSGYKLSSENTLSPVGSISKTVKTNANTFTASSAGIYTVVFFSSALTGDNPRMMKVSDTSTPFAGMQKGGSVASWDISVYQGSTLQSGRVFTKELFINMGGNALSNKVSTGSLYSNIYAVTDDGYQYRVDFNGMDPYGFVFFANNRGLLKVSQTSGGTSSASSSLYHGVRSDNNQLSDFIRHSLRLNNNPYDADLDRTYRLFYEQPSKEALDSLAISDPETGAGGITNFKFTGTDSAKENVGYVGKGGSFSFDASSNISATSYEIRLDFSSAGGGVVTLSNTLVKGNNSISWDGKDANGKAVPAGTYKTLDAQLVLKGGEVHFPLLDVEQNPNGIKITRLNGIAPDSMVYFNNSALNAGSSEDGWTLAKNWEVGNETDTATDGTDSSGGAMAFTNVHTRNNQKKLGVQVLGDGDQCALDLWAYYKSAADLGTWNFSLVDASFTVTKVWDRGSQTKANPTAVTMLLQYQDGTMWKSVTRNAAGALLTNPVTYDTALSGSSYTWHGLDPSLTYQVTETPITGYTTAVTSSAAKTTDSSGNISWAETITNTYKSTTLTLKKVWFMNGSSETHPASVTLSVYTDKERKGHVGDYTLDDTNNWTKVLDSGDGIDSTLTYYVYETAVNGYTVIGEGKVKGNVTDGFTITIINSFNSGDYKAVGVIKSWLGDDKYAAYQPPEIQITLLRNGTEVTADATGNSIKNPVKLSASDDWYYIWPALLSSSSDATLSGLAAASGSPSDAAVSTVVLSSSPSDSEESLQDGLVEKGSSSDAISVWNGLSGLLSGLRSEASLSFASSSDVYMLEETDQNGNSLLGYIKTFLKNVWTHFAYVEFQNTYQPAKFTVTKSWVNGSGSPLPESVTVHLLQSADNGASYAEYGVPAVLEASSSNAWSYTWSDLPSYDYSSGTAKQFLYKAEEEAVPGYTAAYGAVSEDAACSYSQTITNSVNYTSLTVTKVWNHGSQNKEDWPNAVQITLYENGTAVEGGTLNEDNSWTGTFEDLPIADASGNAIDYSVSESEDPNYTQSYGAPSGSQDTGYRITITNTYNHNPITPGSPSSPSGSGGSDNVVTTGKRVTPPVTPPAVTTPATVSDAEGQDTTDIDGNLPLGNRGLPKTGDRGSALLPFFLLMLAAVISAAFTAAGREKRRK